MSYETQELEQKALAAIKKHKLVFIEDIVSFLPCSKPTFYEHKLNESDAIKSAIEKIKVERKSGLRNKMYNSKMPSAWIALYKLIGTEEEAHRLNGSNQKIDHAGSIEVAHRVVKPKVNDQSGSN
jgi:ribosomal protein S20